MTTTLPECDCFNDRPYLHNICNGVGEWPEGYVTFFREQNGLAPIGANQVEWDVSMKSRGLGDVVAKFTHATGIAGMVNAVSTAMGVPCGCGERQEFLNGLVPFNQ